MQRTLNVLVVSDDNLESSVVYDVHLLSEKLSIFGNKVTVVGSSRDNHSVFGFKASSLSRVYDDSKVAHYQFPYLSFSGINWLYGLVTSYTLIKRLVRRTRFDVIVLYSVLFTGLPCVILSKRLGIPLVFRSIDMLHRLQKNPVKRILVRWLERLVYRNVDSAFVLTNSYGEYIKDIGAPDISPVTIPFPIPDNFFRNYNDIETLRTTWSISQKDFVVIYFGYLYPFSSLPGIIRIVPKIIELIPNFKLLIIGDGPIFEELKELTYSLGVESYVVFTGRQPFESLPGFLELADVGVNAYSLDNELSDLFSAKVLQYMAAGLPVLSAHQPGIEKFLSDSRSDHGVTFVSTTDDFQIQLLKLWSNPKRMRGDGEKNRIFALKRHAISVVVNQLQRELEDLCFPKRKNIRISSQDRTDKQSN